MKTQILQHVKELIIKLEDPKKAKELTPLLVYVESSVYYRFKICCYTQDIEPHNAISNYMKSASSPQTVELIKKSLGGKGR